MEEKRRVLEFLCRLAREKRMYCKQVQSVLDILPKSELWHDTLVGLVGLVGFGKLSDYM